MESCHQAREWNTLISDIFHVLFNRGVIKVSEMIADFFTKPLQGTHFVKMRDIVLNMDLEDSIVEHRSMLENKDWECSTIRNL